jgi:hypothetical protein
VVFWKHQDWANGEPSFSNSNEHGIEMRVDGKWNDIDVNHKMSAVYHYPSGGCNITNLETAPPLPVECKTITGRMACVNPEGLDKPKYAKKGECKWDNSNSRCSKITTGRITTTVAIAVTAIITTVVTRLKSNRRSK